jgi:HEPN domain-containing protein
MNRSADWLHQAQADLDQALLSATAGHHEWACFACHQAVEKALKAQSRFSRELERDAVWVWARRVKGSTTAGAV